MSEMKTVLGNGYVRLKDVMGSDLSVVNAARTSYNKDSHELTDGDKRLIRFLARNSHDSPFRHATVQLEMYAPLMVARQIYKYIVGSDHTMDAWNESSRRYITEEPEFYVPTPDAWRSKPANSKQGSGAMIDDRVGDELSVSLSKHAEEGERLYNEALDAGVAPEQARLFLPAYGLMVRWTWTASLQSVAHFLNQRLADDAQAEITEYAQAIYDLTTPHFPVSLDELVSAE